ncbi:hypothetical protein D9619_000164 [Psilocybe cf. subviscida]|uniref:Uncharacterized protein n=1 Tax=Psilocybe cf. subviscida TaxID=2480587 RepID=A0A8H5BFX2_9AGAR|nr:hypothetical protein D9619_000164 [Psilocybe cf. subviscida]
MKAPFFRKHGFLWGPPRFPDSPTSHYHLPSATDIMQPANEGSEPTVPEDDDRKNLREAIARHAEDNSTPTPAEIQCAEEFGEVTPYFRIAVEVCDGNYEYLSYLATQLDGAKNSARQNDSNRVRENILHWFLPDGISPLAGPDGSVGEYYKPIDTKASREKTRGFHHPDTAYFLCPHNDIPEFLQDPVTFMNDVLNGHHIITDEDFPEFCYASDTTNNKDGFSSYGHLMGDLPRLAHQALSAIKEFTHFHCGFNYPRFYETILEDLEDRTEAFTKDVISGFNAEFPEFGNFPTGRRRRATPRSAPTDNLKTFDTAAKRRAERQKNGYVPLAERQATAVLEAAPYNRAVEKRARVRGQNSTQYLWALESGHDLDFSKPAPQPRPPTPPPQEDDSSDDTGGLGDDFYVLNASNTAVGNIAPVTTNNDNTAASDDNDNDDDNDDDDDDDDDGKLAQLLQQQEAMQQRTKELQEKIHARSMEKQLAGIRTRAAAEAAQMATWARDETRDKLDETLPSDCSLDDLKRTLVQVGTAAIDALNLELATIEEDYARYSQKLQDNIKARATANMCQFWEDKIQFTLARRQIFEEQVTREENAVAAIKRDRNLVRYMAENGEMERRRASTRQGANGIKDTQSVKENIQPKDRLPNVDELSGGSEQSPAKRPRLSGPLTPPATQVLQATKVERVQNTASSTNTGAAEGKPSATHALTDEECDKIRQQRKAVEKANIYADDARKLFRDDEEASFSGRADTVNIRAMLLRVGRRTIDSIVKHIDRVQTKTCDMAAEFDDYHRHGNDTGMKSIDRMMFFANSLMQALRDRRAKEEALNERIDQDPTLQEYYLQQPEFVNEERMRQAAREERERRQAAAASQNSQSGGTPRTSALDDTVFGAPDEELTDSETETQQPTPPESKLIIKVPAVPTLPSSGAKPPRTARKQVAAGLSPATDIPNANANPTNATTDDPPTSLDVNQTAPAAATSSGRGKGKKARAPNDRPLRQSERIKK